MNNIHHRKSPTLAACMVAAGIVALSCCVNASYYDYSSWYTPDGNMALNMPSFQSSTRYGGNAELGNDGGFSRRYWDGTCTHTDDIDGKNSWWTVDLGETKDVKIVHFTPREQNLDRYQSMEVRIGDTRPASDGNGDENTAICSSTETTEDGKVKTVFECSSGGRYVTVRLTATNVPLTVCELMVFGGDKKPETILKPHLLANGECPEPLQGACQSNINELQMSPEDAAVKAFMEGPIQCGDKGFFCRMKADPAGPDGGMTGTPGDQLYRNSNYGYCEDRDEDRQIDFNRLDRQPNNNDGHCHGSEFDTSYIGVLEDHYYRPYRGTIHCCCGLEKEDEDGDWAPAKDYISRCDYRGREANDAKKNFERGCGLDMRKFIGKDDFPNPEQCWTLDHFGKPVEKVIEMPPYSQPELRVTECSNSSCTLDLASRWNGHARLMMSSQPLVEPRMIDDISSCNEIYDIQINEAGLMLKDWEDLENVPTDAAGRSVKIGLTYEGCYKDNGSRAFNKRMGKVTMEECAYAALEEGSSFFGMQWPQGGSGEDAECFIDDKGVRTEDPDDTYGRRPDEECKGEEWNPTFLGQEFEFNGSGWRNAVYSLKATNLEGEEVELSFDYTLLTGLEAGKTTYVQAIDLYTCAVSEVVSLTTSA